MEYKLEYFSNEELRVYNLNKEIVTLGKLPENDIELKDNTVSRWHCQIVRIKEGYKLVDQGSTNGCYVNGRRVEETALTPGDNITVGRTILKFQKASSKENYKDISDQQISMVVPLSDVVKIKEKKIKPRELQFLTALTNLGKELISSPNMEDSFKRVGELIFEFVKPERVFIFSYDSTQKDLVLKYAVSKSGDKVKTVNISKTIAMKAINEKVAILSSKTKDDSRFDRSKSIIMYGITSAISVPIWTKDSIFGLIYVDTMSFVQAFGEKELEFMSIIANFAGLSVEGINSLEKLNRERRLRSRLERYHSPAVVSRLMGFEDEKTGELMSYKEVDASVLFMDIVEFTSRAEKMTAVEVGIFLNNFFTEMTEVIFKHNGTLDKFIGDGVMAVFGVPISFKNHAELAIMTALDMLQKKEEMNRNVPEAEHIKVRIGIHSGKLISGDFGSPRRLDYTVLGNTVNVASRLESSVAGPNEILVSEAVYKATKGKFSFETIGEKKLQGISRQIKLYRVIGKKEGA